MLNDELRCGCCSAGPVSRAEVRFATDSCARFDPREHGRPLRFAKHFSAAVFFPVVLSVASISVEDEDGAVFAADFDGLAGGGALVEQVETWLRIIVWNPFADGLPVGGMGSGENSTKIGPISRVEARRAHPKNRLT